VSGKLEKGRVNKALGLVQSGDRENKYNTTIQSCECPDSKFNPGGICKHRVAMMMDVRISEREDVDEYRMRNHESEKVRKTEDQLLAELGY
jgi:uncharacterized Zn finger protein